MTVVSRPSDAPPAGAPQSDTLKLASGAHTYSLGLLLLIGIFNMIDRQIFSIVAEPIKKEFQLHDWQVGLMAGTAFAIFYSLLGIPIARIAERWNRPWIISISLALWSGFTVLCGLAQSALYLVLARIGVGVGEAGSAPASHSLVSDYVPKQRRASALAFLAMSAPLGLLVGNAVGGTIADAWGWRAAFVVCGGPGLVLAVVTVLTLPEPRNGPRLRRAAGEERGPTFWQVLGVLRTKPTYWLLTFAGALKSFIGFGIAPFMASFFLRNHAEEVSQLAHSVGLQSLGFLGVALGITSGVAGAAGALVGGAIADHLLSRSLRSYISMPALATLVTIPLMFVALTTSSALVALGAIGIYSFFLTFWYGATYSTIQSIVPPQMRATAASLMFLIMNLGGLGLGPLVVGLLSDTFATRFGMGTAEGLRAAMMSTMVFAVLVSALFWLAGRTIERDVED